MAYDIGARIGIDGEAQFKSSLKAINGEIRALGAEMKAVTSSFGNSEDSVESLRAKNEVLSRQIEAMQSKIGTLTTRYDQQKAKLDELGEALERAKAEHDENSKAVMDAQSAYDRQAAKCSELKTQIFQATAKLNDMTGQVAENEKSIEDLENASDDAGDDVDELGKSAKDAGEKMDGAKEGASNFAEKLKKGLTEAAKVAMAAVAAASTAVAAFAKSSIEVGAEFDSAMSQVAAVSGATGEDFDALRDKAMEMGAQTKFSATESAEAFNYMAMAGWKTEDMLGGIEGIMNLAAASGEDLATTSDIVTDALTAFGMTADESGHFADVLAAASSNANTNVGMLGESFKYVAPLAGTLGYNAEDMALALGLMANSGIKASQAGTSLRAALSSIIKPTETVSTALSELGLMAQATDEFQGVTDNMGEYNSLLLNSDGTTKSFMDTMTSLRSVFSGLSESQQTYYATTLFGREAMSGMLAIINASDEDFQKLTESVYSADGAALQMANTMQDNLAGDITIFKSALEGAQIVISDQLTPTLREFVKFGTDSVSALTKAFQEGGIDGVMAELGNIISRGVAMIIKDLPKMVKAGMKLLGALGQGIIDNLPEIIDSAEEIIDTLLDGVTDALPDLIHGAADIITTLTNGLAESLPDLMDSAEEIITTLVTGIVDALPDILSAGGQMLDELVSGIEAGLPDMVSRLPQVIEGFLGFIDQNLPTILDEGTELLNRLVNGIVAAIPDLVAELPQLITAFVNFITQNLPKIASAGVNLVVNLVKGLIEALPKIAAAVPDLIHAIVNGIVSLHHNVVETGREIVRKLAEGLGLNDLINKGKELIDTIKNGVKQKIEDAKNWGKDLIKNFVDGITAKWDDLKKKVSNVAQTVKDFLGFSEPKMGPLSNFHTFAPDMMELFAKGVADNAGVVQKQLNKALAFDFDTINGDFGGEFRAVERDIGRSMEELRANSMGAGAEDTGTAGQRSGSQGSAGVDPDALAAAVARALDGAGVILSGRKVGQLITGYQANDVRARGVNLVPV